MKDQTIIHKAKLKKGTDLIVEYSVNSTAGASTITQVCKQPVHPDLIKSFQALSDHLARLCEQYDKSGQLSDRIQFRGFTIRGEEDNQSVILTGIRTVSGNKALLLNSPRQRFGEEGEDVGYEEIQELIDALDLAQQEVLAYIYDAKHSPNPQMELFGPEEPDDVDPDDDDN